MFPFASIPFGVPVFDPHHFLLEQMGVSLLEGARFAGCKMEPTGQSSFLTRAEGGP